MATPHDSRPNIPALVCLEPSGAVWDRMKALSEKALPASEFILMRTARTGGDLLELCRRLLPAILVVGEEQLKRLPMEDMQRMLRPGAMQILLFSDQNDDAALQGFFRQGCSGVVSSVATHTTLLRAIRAVFAGEIWMPRRLLSQLAREATQRVPAPQLTRRETEILQMISRGSTNQEIADHYFISRETVRWHIRSLYDKIGVENREEAMREAPVLLGRAGKAAEGGESSEGPGGWRNAGPMEEGEEKGKRAGDTLDFWSGARTEGRDSVAEN